MNMCSGSKSTYGNTISQSYVDNETFETYVVADGAKGLDAATKTKDMR